MRRSFLFACLALTVSIGMAQTMSRPVRIVVPFPAGSTTDAMARVLAERLGKSLGEPVIVENKPGANTIIGADTVAKAPPDGRTILLATDATYTINPLLYPKLPYKKSDLVPVSILAHIPAYVMVRATLPIQSLEELIAYAKANPGKLNYGSLGPGSGPHFVHRGIQARLRESTWSTSVQGLTRGRAGHAQRTARRSDLWGDDLVAVRQGGKDTPAGE